MPSILIVKYYGDIIKTQSSTSCSTPQSMILQLHKPEKGLNMLRKVAVLPKLNSDICVMIMEDL